MTRLQVRDLPLDGLKLIERTRSDDARGSFSRVFCAEELAAAGWERAVAQVNVTQTARTGTVRGLHFQRPPHHEAKLVHCLRGAVFDVVVDVRVGSATFLRWHAVQLSEENGLGLLVPAGMAHGFQALTDDVEMLYFHSAPYEAAAEHGLRADDPRLAINWPLPVTLRSARDAAHPLIDALAPESSGVLL